MSLNRNNQANTIPNVTIDYKLKNIIDTLNIDTLSKYFDSLEESASLLRNFKIWALETEKKWVSHYQVISKYIKWWELKLSSEVEEILEFIKNEFEFQNQKANDEVKLEVEVRNLSNKKTNQIEEIGLKIDKINSLNIAWNKKEVESYISEKWANLVIDWKAKKLDKFAKPWFIADTFWDILKTVIMNDNDNLVEHKYSKRDFSEMILDKNFDESRKIITKLVKNSKSFDYEWFSKLNQKIFDLSIDLLIGYLKHSQDFEVSEISLETKSFFTKVEEIWASTKSKIESYV